MVPKSIRTIAIPAFGNATTRYRLTERLPQAISRELIAKSRFRIVADPREADAILEGSVLNYQSYAMLFDPQKGRASAAQMLVTLAVTCGNAPPGRFCTVVPTSTSASATRSRPIRPLTLKSPMSGWNASAAMSP